MVELSEAGLCSEYEIASNRTSNVRKETAHMCMCLQLCVAVCICIMCACICRCILSACVPVVYASSFFVVCL